LKNERGWRRFNGKRCFEPEEGRQGFREEYHISAFTFRVVFTLRQVYVLVCKENMTLLNVDNFSRTNKSKKR